MQAIMSRHSVRSYTAELVSDEMIERLLRAAMQASSSTNEQPWHFIVIRERAILDAVPSFHQFAKMLPQTSVAVLVCGDEALENMPGRWVIDCSAAAENLLLAAHALGLGAVWLGIYPNDQRVAGMRRLIEMPESVHPLALIPIGYPAVETPASERYQASRVHQDRW
jgi:nitroreductase